MISRILTRLGAVAAVLGGIAGLLWIINLGPQLGPSVLLLVAAGMAPAGILLTLAWVFAPAASLKR